MEASDSLLTIHVHGDCDELHHGARIIDAIAAECVRRDARKALVDLGELDGLLTRAYQAELEHYAAARLACVKCALVLPPEFASDLGPVRPRATFAAFATARVALEWLQASVAPTQGVAMSPRAEHTLVHLI